MKPLQMCPVCDFGTVFPRALLKHFLREHGRPMQDKGYPLRYTEGVEPGTYWPLASRPNMVHVRCWCGKVFRHQHKGSSQWARHLYANGGLFTHVYRLALEGKLQ